MCVNIRKGLLIRQSYPKSKPGKKRETSEKPKIAKCTFDQTHKRSSGMSKCVLSNHAAPLLGIQIYACYQNKTCFAYQ